MFEVFAALDWIVYATFAYLFFTRLLGSNLKLTGISKIGIKTFIVTAVIAFLIPLPVRHISSALVDATIHLVFGMIDPIIEDVAFFFIQVGINLFIYFFPVVKDSALVFTKDLKSTISVLVSLLTFGTFAFLAFTFDFAEDYFITFIGFIGLSIPPFSWPLL